MRDFFKRAKDRELGFTRHHWLKWTMAGEVDRHVILT
jgi:hypothetical protein